MKVTAENCVLSVGDLSREGIILVGGIFPTTSGSQEVGIAMQRAAILAARDIGVSGVITSEGKRPFGFLACAAAADPTPVVKHLVETVGVPAIITSDVLGRLKAYVETVSVPKQTFVLTTTETSRDLTLLDHKGLVLGKPPSDDYEIAAMAAIGTDTEARVRSEGALPPSTKLRTAVIGPTNTHGQEADFRARLRDKLVVNGAPLSAASNVSYFSEVSYPIADERVGAEVANAVNNFQADIVVATGGTELGTYIIPAIEKIWTGPRRPRYVLRSVGRTLELIAAVTDSPALASRIYGTSASASVQALSEHFRGIFASEYGVPPPDQLGVAESFDSVYLVAMAMSSQRGELGGRAVAEGMKRLVGPGSATSPRDAATAMRTLSSSDATLKFGGPSGYVDWDFTTGQSRGDIDVWCIGTTGGVPVFRGAGAKYDYVKQALTGALTCP